MIEIQEHYGVEVETNVAMDVLRKTECLCLACREVGDCVTAGKLYEICKRMNMAIMITRCQLFVQSDNQGKPF